MTLNIKKKVKEYQNGLPKKYLKNIFSTKMKMKRFLTVNFHYTISFYHDSLVYTSVFIIGIYFQYFGQKSIEIFQKKIHDPHFVDINGKFQR